MNVLGIDLGGTNTKVVRLGEDLSVQERLEFPTARSVEAYESDLGSQLDRLAVEASEIDAVGIAFAGLVDDRRTIVQAPNLPFFEQFDVFPGVLSWSPCAAILLENDVNAAIVGEHRLGAGRGCEQLCMLSLGTGVGGGVIVAGELHRGAFGFGGELGHIILDHDGPLCTCGQSGHVESFLSTPAIVQRAREALEAEPSGGARLLAIMGDGDPDPRALAAAARSGCTLSGEILAECGRWLGIACTTIAHAFQPERIIIGGGVSQAGELLLKPAREEYERRLMRSSRGKIPMVRAELGVDGAAIGAALLARGILDEARA